MMPSAILPLSTNGCEWRGLSYISYILTSEKISGAEPADTNLSSASKPATDPVAAFSEDKVDSSKRVAFTILVTIVFTIRLKIRLQTE